jgi:hypothetical protein
MFDALPVADLLAEMSAAQRDERVATARRLFAAGRLCQRRMAAVAGEERAQWCVDNWEAVAAEVGAELGISRGRASAQMNYGLELLERLPKLGAAFAAGEVEFRVIAAAVFRTGLIIDREVLRSIDLLLARYGPSWNRLSQKRLAGVIDRWVAELDPLALRNSRSAEQDRHVEFGEARDGMVEFWGALRAADAAVLERRIDELAAEAPADDIRTKAQRRADALASLGAGGIPGTSGQIVVHVLADAATLDGRSEKPGHLAGYGNIPPAMLRELAQRSRLRPLTPAALLCQEPRYRPSAALAAFIRCRDLHCRFPGCDKPAEHCDIDHTVPWQQGGPTHPWNLGLLCRVHHLLKTFWTGENGWSQRQHSDGTMTWTSPSGRRYTTTPGGVLLYPQLAEPTAELSIIARQDDSRGCRTAMMPTRRRTRADERAARIRWERGLNESRWAAEPPPF